MIGIPAAAVSALKAGNKVEAIKITREAHGASLKEALAAVEDHLAAHSDVNDAYLQMRQRSNGTASLMFRIALALLLAGIAAYYFGH